jgi:hypothetical protein
MIQAAKKTRASVAFTGVFQYHSNGDCDIECLKNYLIKTLFQCLESKQPLNKLDFKLKLRHGSFSPRGKKDFHATLRELIWKHSELTGKYCGCQYWSANAKSVFNEKLLEYVDGRIPTLKDAQDVTSHFSKQSTDKNERLVHEHVFPINHLLLCLQDPNVVSSFEQVKTMIEQRAIGCVVLESEHSLLDAKNGNCDNPWLRYKGKIRLLENPSWPLAHRELIEKAELWVPDN